MDFTEWRKSARSGNQSDCVAFRHNDETVQVKDTKDPDGPVLSFTHDEWRAFVGGVKGAEFDI